MKRSMHHAALAAAPLDDVRLLSCRTGAGDVLQVYDSNKGRFTDLGVLDVQQIFGRAGRPQFDTFGEAHLITTHDKLSHYLGMLTASTPIESQFVKNLPDNLNAEVVLGTVSNVKEAMAWLSYSYLHVRLQRNPLAYGITMEQMAADPSLEGHRRMLVERAAKACPPPPAAVSLPDVALA